MIAIGRYHVLAALAKGGMAELFLARFEPVAGFEKTVVLKVLLSFDGAVKLVDFGIAKSSHHTRDSTAVGEVRGTLPYLSPEQCRKQPLDRRSDVFSLCALLYEVSTGTRLHDAAGDYEIMR